jgi:hypothetical protein
MIASACPYSPNSAILAVCEPGFFNSFLVFSESRPSDSRPPILILAKELS